MKKYENYDSTQAFTGEFEKLELGGHVCKITTVTVVEKPYGELMTVEFDIAEGKQKDFYRKRYLEAFEKQGINAKWQGKYYQTIKNDDLKFFKGFITAIENSNSGFKFDFDEKKLVGKLFGGVFGEEEYQGNDGKIKTATKIMQIRSVEAIKSGDIKVPELKRLAGQANAPQATQEDVNDCPF